MNSAVLLLLFSKISYLFCSVVFIIIATNIINISIIVTVKKLHGPDGCKNRWKTKPAYFCWCPFLRYLSRTRIIWWQLIFVKGWLPVYTNNTQTLGVMSIAFLLANQVNIVNKPCKQAFMKISSIKSEIFH